MSRMKSSDKQEKTALLMESDDDDTLLDTIGAAPGTSTKMNNVQQQVNDVTDTMKKTIDKVLDRGQNLNELSDRTDQLTTSADLFSKRARHTRRSMWMRTCRARLFLGITIGAIIVIFHL